MDNLKTFYEAVLKSKSENIKKTKGSFIKKVSLASTMGFGLEINIGKDCPLVNTELSKLTEKYPDLRANILGVIKRSSRPKPLLYFSAIAFRLVTKLSNFLI